MLSVLLAVLSSKAEEAEQVESQVNQIKEFCRDLSFSRILYVSKGPSG